MEHSLEVEEEKRWEDTSLSGPTPQKGVRQGANCSPPAQSTTGAAAPAPGSALSSLSPDALWDLLQQRLLNIRQQVAVAEQAWKTAMLERQQLDIIFNGPKPVSDEVYDRERKNLAARIQQALNAIMVASAKEKEITDHLVVLGQLSDPGEQSV